MRNERKAFNVERNVNIMSSSIIWKSFEQRVIIRPIGVRSKNDNGNRSRLWRNRENKVRDAFTLVSNIMYVPRNSKTTRKSMLFITQNKEWTNLLCISHEFNTLKYAQYGINSKTSNLSCRFCSIHVRWCFSLRLIRPFW